MKNKPNVPVTVWNMPNKNKKKIAWMKNPLKDVEAVLNLPKKKVYNPPERNGFMFAKTMRLKICWIKLYNTDKKN